MLKYMCMLSLFRWAVTCLWWYKTETIKTHIRHTHWITRVCATCTLRRLIFMWNYSNKKRIMDTDSLVVPSLCILQYKRHQILRLLAVYQSCNFRSWKFSETNQTPRGTSTEWVFFGKFHIEITAFLLKKASIYFSLAK